MSGGREVNLREDLAFDQPTGPRIDVRGHEVSGFFSALCLRMVCGTS